MAGAIQKFILRQQMLRGRYYEIYHFRDCYLKDVTLHHHDFYEIYLFLSGSVSYTIESRNYHLSPGDLLLISPFELHQPRIVRQDLPYERIVLWLRRSFVEQCSSSQTSLTRCFDSSLPHHTNLLRLPAAARQRIRDLMDQLVADSSSTEYGCDLMAASNLVRLLVEINREAERLSTRHEVADKSGAVIAEVLNYINENYQVDLSLDSIAARFFVNKYHLSHEFNRLVGTSMYRYIIQKRLVIAKQMLSDQVPPTAVYRHCGFGDYSNFYRAFKAEYGISPKEFISLSQETDK